MPRISRTGSIATALAGLLIAGTLSACGSTGSGNSGNNSGGTTGSAAAPKSGGGASFSTAACTSSSGLKPGFSNGVATVAGAAKSLSGAGSTFAAPAYSVWTKAYASTGTQVAYQSIGSGGGVAQIQAQTVDFGDSDTPMTDADLQAAKGGAILHIPLLVGSVVPAYHLSGIGSGLKFTGDVLGKIYAGQITKWNDPELTKLNPGVKLPDEQIAVAHRSDGSGTTGIWTNYLTKESPTWVSKLGGKATSAGKEVAWPVGIGGKGNEGVSGVVQQTEGALGYLELQYALAQNTTFGQVQNADKSAFVQPCLATDTAAADKANFPADLRGDLTDEPGTDSYPIAGTTYALVYQNQKDKAKAAALVNFFSWVLTKGQDLNSQVSYSPLGAPLQKRAMAQLSKITVNGKPVAG
jgi:phosphate transport system substrate-binding protein